MRRPLVLLLPFLLAALVVSCDIMGPDGGPTGFTATGQGYFYMLDRGSVSIVMLDPSMRELKRWSLRSISTTGTNLQGITADDKYLWVSISSPSYAVYQIDPAGDSITVVRSMNSFPVPPSNRGVPRDMAWDPSTGILWYLNSGSSGNFQPYLYRITASTFTVIDSFRLPMAEPHGMTFVSPGLDAYGSGPEKGLYITDTRTDKVYKFLTDKFLVDTAFTCPIPPKGASYASPVGIAYDRSNFWIVNSGTDADHLFRLTSAGKLVNRIDLPYATPGPIAWTAKDFRTAVPLQVYTCMPSSGQRGSLNLSVDILGDGFRSGTGLAASFGDSVTVTALTYVSPTKLTATISIAAGANTGKRLVRVTLPDGRTAADSLFEVTAAAVLPGHLWVLDDASGSDSLFKIRTSDTTIADKWYTRTVSTGGSIQGLGFDGTSLWLATSGTGSTYERKIYELAFNGSTLSASKFINGPTAGGTIRGLTFLGGSMYVAVSTVGKIYKMDPSTGATLDSIIAPGVNPRGLTVKDAKLWCNDTDKDSVYSYDAVAGTWTAQFPVPTIPNGGTKFATGLVWDGTNFWLANYHSSGSNDYIFKLTATGVPIFYFQAPRFGPAEITGMAYTPN